MSFEAIGLVLEMNMDSQGKSKSSRFVVKVYNYMMKSVPTFAVSTLASTKNLISCALSAISSLDV